MKNLEEALRTCHKPEIDAPEFKAALRRELCRRIDARKRGWDRSNPWVAPVAFFSLGTLVFVFAALTTIFIVFPEMPRKLNQLAGISTPQIVMEKKQPELDLKDRFPKDYRTVFSPENDKIYAQQWVKQNYPHVTSQVTGVEEEKIVTLRWVRLDDGRKILVMNEFAPQGSKKTIQNNQNNIGGIL